MFFSQILKCVWREIKRSTVGISNGPKEVGLQIVWILNRIWNPETQPFKIRTNSGHFVKNHLKSLQKCLDFKWSGFRMVGAIAIAKTQPFEIQPSKSPDFKLSDFRSPLYTEKKICFVYFCFTSLVKFSLNIFKMPQKKELEFLHKFKSNAFFKFVSFFYLFCYLMSSYPSLKQEWVLMSRLWKIITVYTRI